MERALNFSWADVAHPFLLLQADCARWVEDLPSDIEMLRAYAVGIMELRREMALKIRMSQGDRSMEIRLLQWDATPGHACPTPAQLRAFILQTCGFLLRGAQDSRNHRHPAVWQAWQDRAQNLRQEMAVGLPLPAISRAA